MPRDKYHPHMVDFKLARRMQETGHTDASVVEFLHPYIAYRATVARWRRSNRVPHALKPLIEKALNTVAPPGPKWFDMDLNYERAQRRITMKFLAEYLDCSVSAISTWEDRRQVPSDRVIAIKKLLDKTLTVKAKSR